MRSRRSLRRPGGQFIVMCLALVVTWGGAATAEPTPLEELSAAYQAFEVAEFPEALAKVDGLLRSTSLGGTKLRDAWILKARCELALDQRSSAIVAFCAALRVDPSWRPDVSLFTTDEKEVFAEATTECSTLSSGSDSPADEGALVHSPEEKVTLNVHDSDEGGSWWKNRWVLAAGGAAVAGSVLLLMGDDPPPPVQPVPGFPLPPE